MTISHLPKHQQGLKPVITKLLCQGLFCPSHSPYNAPVLPVKKPNGSCHLVQDLRLINAAVIPIHPVVPNPYTLFSHSLFHDPLHRSTPQGCLLYRPFTPKLSRPLCLYPDWSRQSSLPQLTRTVLEQGFRDSPHFFGQALASDLTSPDLTPSTVLQYMDDPLLCSQLLTHSQQNTIELLNFLVDRGYRVPPTKVQLSLPRVTHLRVLLTPTKRYITTDRKSLISTLPLPTSKTEILCFLGLAGYLHR